MTKKDFWVLGDGDLDTGISGRTPSRGFGLGNFGRLEEEETWQNSQKMEDFFLWSFR